MGFMWWGRSRTPETKNESSGARFGYVVVPPEMTGSINHSTYAPRIPRWEAITVPAVLRARNLIAGTLATLPVHLHGPDRSEVPSNLLDQPEVGIPRSVSMAALFEDLLFDGVAWWRIVQFDWQGYPVKVTRIDPTKVNVESDGRVYINGEYVSDDQLIRFDSPNPALLVASARAIRTSLKLEAAAARYADEPQPLAYFSPAQDADPADEEVQAALSNWKAARNTRATAYVPAGLKYNEVHGWSPADMQLADARQHAVLEIARATGIDAEDLGVSTTSRTYQNDEQRRMAFLDFTLGPYVSAVQDRLSMGDVTPRGYYARVKFDAFLRTDTLTRYTAYEKGLAVGAIDQSDIRALEDRPNINTTQTVQNGADVPDAQFSRSRENGITFDGPEAAAAFKVDESARTITGLAVPYGPVAQSGFSKWRFQKGSLQYADLSRVKLLRDHDATQAVGVAVSAQDTDAGMVATFKVARGPEGDAVLGLAADGVLDGLSVGIDFEADGWVTDPTDESVRLVQAASWRETSITAMPAFDGARVTSVTASSTERNLTMTNAVEQAAPADTAAFTSAVKDFTAAVDRMGAAPTAGREVVPAGNRAVGFQVTEAPVYTFQAGSGHSLVRDSFNARVEGDIEAADRLRKFNAQQKEMARFATVNRTVGANVIPPGYKPDLYVPQLFQGRPFVDSVSKGTLSDATPFTLPKFGSVSGATVDQVEGTNPTDGSLSINTMTVTPGAITGLFKVTREVVDASNPAIDAIALAAMKESYSQQTEAKIYALLNGANGAGGTITTGYVPSGAAVVAVASAGAGQALLTALRGQLAAYPFRRFQKADRLLLSQEATTVLAQAVDSTGRPLLPRIGDAASVGTASAYNQAYDIDGLAGVPAWSITNNTASDADTFMFSSQDVWAWESPLLTFRYEERSGPALIELALFGYFASAVLRASGISAIRYN